MGEAKKRGTFNERKAEAIKKQNDAKPIAKAKRRVSSRLLAMLAPIWAFKK